MKGFVLHARRIVGLVGWGYTRHVSGLVGVNMSNIWLYGHLFRIVLPTASLASLVYLPLTNLTMRLACRTKPFKGCYD